MARIGSPATPVEVEMRFWDAVRSGSGVKRAALSVGVSESVGWRWLRQRGGVMPPPRRPAGPGGALTFAEREQIALLRAGGGGVREIARDLGRSASTVSRELNRIKHAPGPRTLARRAYRASTAQDDADRRAKRPKDRKLTTNLPLRRQVQDGLTADLSPEQIAGRLRVDFPDDQGMRVSHETIYRSLYVQGRGGLKRELAQHLRTGRVMRKPRRRPDERRGRIPGMVSIAQRPAEVADRAVPGHWEGDLILGSAASGSAIGTLVERTTGFVLLLHLPGNHTADTVATAMATTMNDLPEHLRRSLTWDQGSEMAQHARISLQTGLDVYFCDPHSPWQRGTNENTNGLLRQYFPKGSDLSRWGPGYLDMIAAQLNARPRKRHAFRTPAEVLAPLLSSPPEDVTVAPTA